MEARELKDMTAVLRSINDGNPSNAERWVFLSTLSLRRATAADCAVLVHLYDFYPRSPCGERPLLFFI